MPLQFRVILINFFKKSAGFFFVEKKYIIKKNLTRNFNILCPDFFLRSGLLIVLTLSIDLARESRSNHVGNVWKLFSLALYDHHSGNLNIVKKSKQIWEKNTTFCEKNQNFEPDLFVPKLTENRFGMGSGVPSDGMVLISIEFDDFGTKNDFRKLTFFQIF